MERVRDRMHRAASALEQAGIPYAVIGGNAVAAHVGRVDESAVRNTQDVDILLSRTDLEAAKAALAQCRFCLPARQGNRHVSRRAESQGPRRRPRYLCWRESPIGRLRARAGDR